MILPDTAADALGEADRSTTRSALIRTIVSPYDDPQHGASSRIEIRGADVAISGRAATGFALLVHEFATNAAKRSEEHTSELQSLMRISYAVFCLKKKKKIYKQHKQIDKNHMKETKKMNKTEIIR